MRQSRVSYPPHPRRQQHLLLALLLLILLAVVGVEIWAIISAVRSEEANDNGLLVLHDTQRLALGSSLAVPVQGDDDIIFIKVQNNGELTIVNITVEVTLLSEAQRRRAPVSLIVVCPPLYTDEIVPSLAPHSFVTCRAIYTLSNADIVNGNTLHTSSTAQGTVVSDVTSSIIAVPGTSALPISSIDMDEIIFAIPGPIGQIGIINLVTGYCFTSAPHTTLACSAGNQLQMLVCDLSSNATQIGNIYLCVGSSWAFFGSVNVQGNSTAGTPGIGMFSATCSGGPPPTSVTNPGYTCDSAFNLNMVLCSLASLNGNSGIIYECLCSPTCGWTQVGNLNTALIWINSGIPAFNGNINSTQNVWTDLTNVVAQAVGTYQCFFESQINWFGSLPTCPLYYGITTISQTIGALDNSGRSMQFPSGSTQNTIATIVSTAQVIVTSAPTTIYATAGIWTAATGCGNYHTTSQSHLRCLKTL